MLADELAPLIKLDVPYPGLRSFEPEESFLFYGRKSHTEELLRRLPTNRFLAVVGTSGSGKSSLVRAGLLPALYRGFLAGGVLQWRIAVMKPGECPMANLALALAEQNIPTEKLTRSSQGLQQAVQAAAFGPREGLLIVADQFEELFLLCEQQRDGGAEANLFVTSLLEAADSFALPIYVVLTMRSDFLGDCTQFAGLAEALNRSQYLIPRLTREERREAIEKPVRLVDAVVAPRLVQRLLSDLGDDSDQLPVLQHALNRTFRKWKEAGGNGEIDFEHYEAAHTLEGALNDHADELMAALTQLGRPWTDKIFRCLVTTLASGRAVRRATSLAQIYEILAVRQTAAEAHVRQVIEKYAEKENSLLILSPKGDLKAETVVDISHESLIGRWKNLAAWVKKESEAVRWYRSAEEDALRHARGSAPTWRDPKLALALEMVEKGPWNDAWAKRDFGDCGIEFDGVRKYLNLGAAEQEREKRRARVSWIAIVSLLTAAVIALGAFAWERNRAVSARDQVIGLQKKLSNLDAQVQSKEDERARIIVQLKEAGLSEAQKAALQLKLEAASGDLKKLEDQKTLAEQKVAAGEANAKLSASQINDLQSRLAILRAQKDQAERTATASEANAKTYASQITDQQIQISKLQSDLKKTQDDRDALKRQLEGMPPSKTGTPSAAIQSIPGTSNSPPATIQSNPETRKGKDGLIYVKIPPGKFQMGCSVGDSECWVEEMPRHEVTISKDFWLGQTDVTQAAWKRVMRTEPSLFKGDEQPVENVRWTDAAKYCEAIGGRLPTEAEWEYAARAGSTSSRYGELDAIAWWAENSGGRTHAVGGKRPNQFGLFDMLGNVFQWVADSYGGYSPQASADPAGPRSDRYKVLRGGSWEYPSQVARASCRYKGLPASRDGNFGFRCVEEFR